MHSNFTYCQPKDLTLFCLQTLLLKEKKKKKKTAITFYVSVMHSNSVVCQKQKHYTPCTFFSRSIPQELPSRKHHLSNIFQVMLDMTCRRLAPSLMSLHFLLCELFFAYMTVFFCFLPCGYLSVSLFPPCHLYTMNQLNTLNHQK